MTPFANSFAPMRRHCSNATALCTACWLMVLQVEYRRTDGSIAGAQARVLDFESPENNDWLAVNQFTVAEGQHTNAGPTWCCFVNGLPLA